MPEINGWHLPGKDSFFIPFAENALPKQNGFQREHLMAAFGFVDQFGVAIDVGAHVGFWTRDMALRFKRVYAFEPAADTYDCLRKNMAEHDNVTLAQAAVGPRVAKCEVLDDISRPGNTGSRYVMPGRGSVPMLALDGLPFSGCDLIKIDVEGYELGVLRGAHNIIAKYRPVVIMETDKRFAYRYKLDKHAARRYLETLGYYEVWHERPDSIFIHALHRTKVQPER